MSPILVKGGGLAGQVLQKELARRGMASRLEEITAFPRDKVCGGVLQWDSWEYLSGAFSISEKPVPIGSISHFWRGKKISTIPLKRPMVYVSRFSLDASLDADNRRQRAVETDGEPLEIKASGAPRQTGEWVGFQAGVPGVEHLEMHYGRGIYAGVAPTAEGPAHAAILVRHGLFKNTADLTGLVKRELGLEIDAPVKGTTRIHYGYSGERYAVGDAKLTTHPFLGLGMKHAILSARLMANCLEKGRIADYDALHRRRFFKLDAVSRIAGWIYGTPLRVIFFPLLKSRRLFLSAFEWLHT